MAKATTAAKGISISALLLEGRALEMKKGEVYTQVMEEINRLFPYKLERKDGKVIMTRPAGFELTTFLASQFPSWPVDSEKTPLTFSMASTKAAKQRKGEKMGLSEEAMTAIDAINRFSNWASGWKMSIIRNFNDEIIQREIEEKKSALLAGKSAKEKKDEKVLEEVTKKALAEVKSLHVHKQNPRLFDANGNFKATVVEKLADEDKTALAVNLAKLAPETVQEALRRAGRPVQLAGKIDDLKTSVLIDMLESRARKGEFKDTGKTMLAIKQLRDLLKEVAAPVPAPKKAPAKKVANA